MDTMQRFNRKNLSSKTEKIKQKYDVLQPYFFYRPDLNPIIFLHAICDTRKAWRKVAPIIVNKTGRKAYLIDARNHGESSRSKDSDIDVLTQDVVDFMDDHGIQKAVIVGHSMGGRTAICFALKHPDRTEALIVEDMTPKNVKSGPETLFGILFYTLKDWMANLSADADLSTVKKELLNFILYFGKKTKSPSDSIPKPSGLAAGTSNEEITDTTKDSLIDYDAVAIVKIDGKFYVEYDLDAAESMLLSNFLVQDLPMKNLTFKGNALFLYGDLSFFNLAKDSSVKKLFPKATTKKIKNAMHLIHLQYPEEFAETVSHFILSKDTNVSKY